MEDAFEIEKELNSPVIEALEGEGITIKSLAKSLSKELKAKDTKHFAHQGVVIEERNVEAWDVQQRARIDAHKLRGDYPAERHQLEIPIISRTPEEIKQIRDMVREIADRMRGQSVKLVSE